MCGRRAEDESRTSLLNENEIVYHYNTSNSFSRNYRISCLFGGLLVIVIGIGLGIGLYYHFQEVSDDCGQESCLGSYISPSILGVYENYSISTDSEPCAKVGQNIIDKGGNAVDSIISVLLCMGVTIPESMGLGGGALILIYNSTNGKTETIDAREKAPALAYKDLYKDQGYIYAQEGPLAMGVPGELAGYWHMFQTRGSGRIKWSELFTEVIDMAKNGFPISEHLSTALSQKEEIIMKHKDMKDIYVNPNTGKVYIFGETMIQTKLSQTLTAISQQTDPKKYFYEELSKQIIEDIKNADNWGTIKPIITVEDFVNYTVRVETPVIKTFSKNNITLHSFPLPGSGNVLSFIMNVMQRYEELYPSAVNSRTKARLFYHRLVETYKFAFSQRSHLGDGEGADYVDFLMSDKFAEEVKKKIDDSRTFDSNSTHYDAQVYMSPDHGTAHASVIDREGNAVAVSTTVNGYFGAKIMSSSTGILLNNQMDDFNTGQKNEFDIDPSQSNYVEPFRRPLSSMAPTVFTDSNGLRLVIGGSGGPKITTAIASVAIRNLWFGENIKQAIDGSRVHHQLFPDKITYEEHFPEYILSDLEAKGHTISKLNVGDRGAIIMAISRQNDKLYANSDYRKGGTVAGE